MSKIGKSGLFDNNNEMTKAFEIAVYKNRWIREVQDQQQTRAMNGSVHEKTLVATEEAENLSLEEKLMLKLNEKVTTDLTELNAVEYNSINFFKRRPNYIIEKKQKST